MITPKIKTIWIGNLMAGVVSLICCGFFSVNAALAKEPAPQKAARETPTIDVAEMKKPWTGDLDGMIERRVIGVLTAYSKTHYFAINGVVRGIAVDFVRQFEEELNKKLAAEKKLKQKHLKVRAGAAPWGIFAR